MIAISQQMCHNVICVLVVGSWFIGLVFPNQGQGHTERSKSVSQSFCIFLVFCIWHFSESLEFQNVNFSNQNMVDIVLTWTRILPVNLRKFIPEQKHKQINFAYTHPNTYKTKFGSHIYPISNHFQRFFFYFISAQITLRKSILMWTEPCCILIYVNDIQKWE